MTSSPVKPTPRGLILIYGKQQAQHSGDNAMRRYCYPAIQQYSNAGILNYLPVHISAKQRGDRRKDMQVNKPSKTKNSTAKRLASTLTLAEDDDKERLIHATFTIESDIHKRFKMESVRSGVPMSRMLTEWIKKHCPEEK